MNQAQLDQHIAENPRIDLAGNVMKPGDLVIFSAPVPLAAAATQLAIGKVVRFTEHGVTIDHVKGKRNSWSAEVFNTPYRPEKFLRVDSVPDLVLE